MVTVTEAEARDYLGLPADEGDLHGLRTIMAAAHTEVYAFADATDDDGNPVVPDSTAKLAVLKLTSFHWSHRGAEADFPRPHDALRVTGVIGLLTRFHVRGAVT